MILNITVYSLGLMVAIFLDLTLMPTTRRRKVKKTVGHRVQEIQNATVSVGTRQKIVTTKNSLELLLLPKPVPDAGTSTFENFKKKAITNGLIIATIKDETFQIASTQ